MHKTQTEHPTVFRLELPAFLIKDPSLMVLIVLTTGLLILGLVGKRRKKGILARATLANKTERVEAQKAACKAIRDQKINNLAVYIGSPNGTGLIRRYNGKIYPYIPEDSGTLYIPKAEESIIVFGAPGSGKSYSVIDPIGRSGIEQGHSIVCYDFKGYEESGDRLAPSSVLGGYAREWGYEVFVVAPGYKDSDRVNIEDYIRTDIDLDRALSAAEVLHKNLKLSDDKGGGSNPFFKESGQFLIAAVLLLAKSYAAQDPAMADIALCQKILALEGFGERLKNANLKAYQKVAFDQYLSTLPSPETAASIVGTAQLLFQRFMTPDILSVFTGNTTIPLKLEGRQMVIFRMDPQKKGIFPLVSTLISLMIGENSFTSRSTPILYLLDEFSTIFIPDLPELPNLTRSSGSIFCLAAQSFAKVRNTYGEDGLKSLLGGISTQIVMGLADNETSEYYSKHMDKEQVDYWQHSNSQGKGGNSTSNSEHLQTRDLMQQHEFTQLDREMILFNSGYKNKRRKRIPYRTKITIPERDKVAIERSKILWRNFKAKKMEFIDVREPSDAELKAREAIAETLLPLPSQQVLSNQTTDDLSMELYNHYRQNFNF